MRVFALGIVLPLLLFSEQFLSAATKTVYHERSTNNPGCGTVPYAPILNPTAAQAYDLRFRVKNHENGDNYRVYYTTNGSLPFGGKGFASNAATRVVSGAFVCTAGSGGAAADIAGAAIPPQPAGTLVRYVVGAWHGSNPEGFANSTTTITQAIVFQYTVAAAPPDPLAVYWDKNGMTNGAGSATPTGVWGTDGFWSGSFDGTSVTTNWVDGRKAVFSAGTDASGSYTVTVNGTRTAAALRFEEGTVTLSGGTVNLTNGAEVNVATGLTAIDQGTITGAGVTLTKNGAGEFRYQGAGLPNTTFAKLAVNDGLFQLGLAGGSMDERGFGAVPASFTPDAVTIANGASIGASFDVTLHVNRGINLGAGGGAFNTSLGTITIPGIITGSGNLIKNTGTLVLKGANLYGGVTIVSAGTLRVANTTGSATGPGNVTVSSGATLSGAGTVAGAVTLNGTITPGAAEGTMNTGSQTWNGGGHYVWEINSTAGAEGADPGWDLINITGGLAINATGGNQFNVDIASLTLGNAPGEVFDFNNGAAYTWRIVRTTSGITGFDPLAVHLNTAAFANSVGSGHFSLELANGNNDLVLRFIPALVISCPPNVTAQCLAGVPAAATDAASFTAQGGVIDSVCSGPLTVASSDAVAAGGCPNRFTVTRTYIVSDSCSTTSRCAQIITINDNTPPTIACANAKTVECSTPWNFDGPTAADNCGQVVVNILGTVTNTAGRCGKSFEATRTWQASDDCGNAGTCSQTVTVRDTTAPTLTCAPNKTVECGSAWNFDEPTVSDTCGDATIAVVSTTTNVTGHCGNTLETTRTWRATDDCGNISMCSQTVTVRDTTPPSLTCVAGKTVECSNSWSFDPPSASDACGTATVTILSTTTNTIGYCANTFDATRTWQAMDDCGNTTTCTQMVTVVDTTMPVVSCVGPKMVNCAEAWSFDLPTASDSCSEVTIAPLSTTTNQISPCLQELTRTWRVVDACGNSAQCSQTVTLQDDSPLTVLCLPNKSAECGSPWSFDPPQANKVCSGASGLVTIVSTTTNYNGCAETFTATRTWRVSDGCGHTNTCSQTVSVVDTTPPVIVCLPDKTVGCGAAWAFDTPAASDACVFDSLVYDNSVHNLATRFDPGADEVGDEIVLDGTARFLDSFTLEYWGTSGNGSASFVGAVQARLRFYKNDGPPFNGAPTPGTILYDSGDRPVTPTIRSMLTFTDFTNNAVVPLTGPLADTFTWSIRFGGLGLNDHAGLDIYSPPVVGQDFPDYWHRTGGNWQLEADFMTPIDFAARGLAAHTSAKVQVMVLNTITNSGCGTTYSATRAWVATDPCGNTNVCTQTVSVVDAVPPSITCPASKTVECGVAWTFDNPTATDACGSAAINILGTITNSICGHSFLALRTWEATDACNNSSTCTQAVTVVDTTPPQISCAPSFTVECGVAFAFAQPQATDICDGTNVAIEIVTTTISLDCGKSLTTTRTWSATDGCGNSNTCSQTITAVDTTPPTVSCLPDKTVECGTAWNFDLPNASDNCGLVAIAIVSTATNAACGGSFSATRTWRGTDECGNSSLCSQTVTLVDSLPPALSCAPDSTVQCGQSWAFTPPTANDLCAGTNVNIAITETVTNNNTCGHTFSATRTWSATDGCGNSNTCSQTVTVTDTLGPSIVCAANKSVECDTAWTFDNPVATDECDGTNVVITVLDTTTNLCGGTFAAMRSWKAVDTCSNSSVCTQTVTVVDTRAPLITCPGNIVTNNEPGRCSATVSFSATAMDSCSGANVDCIPPSGSSFPVGVNTVICRAWDSCNNTNTCSFTIKVNDIDPPAICANTNLVLLAGTADDFVGPEPAAPSAALEEYLGDFVTERQFDECSPDAWLAHSFTVLPANISSAKLRFKIRACSGTPENDTISLVFAEPGGALRAERWTRAFGRFNGVDGLFGSGVWSAGSTREFELDLSALPNADGSFTNLLTILHSERSLDILIQNYTDVDYLRLEIETCQCQPDIVACKSPATNGALVSFPSPPFIDNCGPPAVNCAPPSGSFFPVGETFVICTASDAAGNGSGKCAFVVRVLPQESSPTSLSVVHEDTYVDVRWLATCVNYELQAAPDLQPPVVWSPVSAPVVFSAGYYRVTVPVSNQQRYFRLKRP